MMVITLAFPSSLEEENDGGHPSLPPHLSRSLHFSLEKRMIVATLALPSSLEEENDGDHPALPSSLEEKSDGGHPCPSSMSL